MAKTRYSRNTAGVHASRWRAASVLIAMTIALPVWAQGTPTYDSDATRALVERMIEAHGGLDGWWSAPALDYTMVMYLAALPVGNEMERRYADNWRMYRATLEPRSSRGYVRLPIEDTDSVQAGSDGMRVWRRPYTFDVQQFRDGPFQLLYFHYAMISLPWLTQQDAVHLARAEDSELPGKEGTFLAVDMTFSPAGKTHDGFYRLLIDPETYRVSGWVATTGFPLLPGNVLPAALGGDSPANNFRVVDDWVTVDGLVLPQSYTSILVTDEETRMIGTHLVVDPSFRARFDTELLAPPSGATVVSEGR